jgi:type IV pilus assembly protein PilQ
MRYLWLTTLVLLISGCAGMADRQLSKEAVPQSPNQVRDIVKDLRDSNPIEKKDLSEIIKAPEDKDRIRDLFTKQGTSDPTIFNHHSWKPNTVSTNLNGVSLTDFFALVGHISGVNFIVGQDVAGDVTVQLKNMNWTDAVDTVLSTKRLVSYISEDGKNVRIHSVEFAAERSDTLKKLLTQRIDEQRARDSLVQKDTSIIRVYYTKADVVARMLREMLSALETRAPGAGAAMAMTSNRALFTVDVRTNSLIVQASSQDLDWIKKTIATIDRPSRQVLVEAFIVEGRDNFTQELGVRMGVNNVRQINDGPTFTTSGVAGRMTTQTDGLGVPTGTIGSVVNPAFSGAAAGGLGMMFSSNTTQIKLELLGMERDGLTKIISNPRLFIIDNEQASITDGVQIPYPVAGTGANQITYEFKDAALKLDVKPSIVGDGNIYIEVIVNKDSPNYTTNPPAIDKREVKTKLLIKDGGVAMIGGINSATINSTDNQVPILGSIPFLGNLFKNTAQGNDRRQLYIFLAPSAL